MINIKKGIYLYPSGDGAYQLGLIRQDTPVIDSGVKVELVTQFDRNLADANSIEVCAGNLHAFAILP